MRRSVITTALCFVAVLALPPRAEATSFPGTYEGSWHIEWRIDTDQVSMRGETDADGVIANTVEPPVAVFQWGDLITLDARLKEGKSFKRRGFRASAGDLASAQSLIDVYAQPDDGPVKRRKTVVGLQPVSLSTAAAKGRVIAKRSSLVLDAKLTYTVTGEIASGPYAGQTFKGKVKIAYRGDRDVF